MTIDANALSSIALEYTKAMTSIRGRRVQRLVKREFTGAAHVLLVGASSGVAAVLGVSAYGAALCATDGRGKVARVVKWLHGASAVHETQFDLHKDSLPALGTSLVPLARLREHAALRLPPGTMSAEARLLVAKALDALA